MPVKTYKPTTPSRRFTASPTFAEITSQSPQKRLVKVKKNKAGRNSAGRITTRHRGGGVKRKYRLIDFRREKHDVPATVATIEYDPNRSARIALLHYADGEKRYILAPDGLEVGMKVVSSEKAEPQVGNTMPLARIPLSMEIHNIEMRPGRGGQLARSAGLAAVLMSREGKYANVRLPSGEIRLIHVNCRATIGSVGHKEHESIQYGKAGAKRWLGIRPTVRGRAMNPIDHPLGGGEGRATGGLPRSPWGKYTKGMKTRVKRNRSNRFILTRRK